ncbi:hypothetical protein [Candidatus Kuenenia stuttgartiensis]|uniref:CD-NTase-associated protein 12/Pycsar effector protein TIR domain-containing protein n=1 Tax=Kuenenia stuttgartiensis TaxID=174633 RepID=Q1Q6J3_KUEST|nr:hypothetical protein [Candidatus Kuenenia stuttgartiensis]CAJ73192.1 unknown protein [Candidatus Kuenenia stuttgartiensis]
MALTIQANEKCLVRHMDCKWIFGGSRICFVACPNSDEIALELEVIKQKLRCANIEPYVAVDNRDFQKDIFCEKICTKIIESLFCIAILNDVPDPKDGIRKPNANVYYEYGLMTAFKKRIIPVQRTDHQLAFNIQSLDTLKYNPGNFPKLIEEAIQMTMLSFDERNIEKEECGYDINRAEWALDLMGMVRADERFRFRHDRVVSSKSLGFQAFTHPSEGTLNFVGIFLPEENEKEVLLRSKMLTLRVKNYCSQLSADLAEAEKSLIYSPRPMVEQRLGDLRVWVDQFRNSRIVIVKDNIHDTKMFKDEYAAAVKDLDFSLSFEVIDNEKMKQLLGS